MIFAINTQAAQPAKTASGTIPIVNGVQSWPLTLGFLQLRQDPPEVYPFRRYLDSWGGVGDSIAGLHAQALDIELRRFPYGWRVNLCAIRAGTGPATPRRQRYDRYHLDP